MQEGEKKQQQQTNKLESQHKTGVRQTHASRQIRGMLSRMDEWEDWVTA